MGKKLSTAPLYYTVVQVQFNPILNLDDYMASIQPEFRKLGFPDYKKDVRQRLVINPNPLNPNSQSVPSIIQETRNFFGDINGQVKFILDANAITFETTNYETYETFVELFISGLEIVNTTIGLTFTERVGLRYLNAVYPINNDNLNQYLVNEVRGVKDRINANFVYTFTETVTETDIGELTSRTVIRNGAITLPDDLAMQTVKINPKFLTYEGEHAVIDSDAFTLTRQTFSLQNIQNTLEELHIYADNSFKASVTDYALSVWK